MERAYDATRGMLDSGENFFICHVIPFNKYPRVQRCVPNFANIEIKIAKERLWKKDCEKKIVKGILQKKDYERKIVKERLWKKDCERKILKKSMWK